MLPLLLGAGALYLYSQTKKKDTQGAKTSAPVPGSKPGNYTPAQPSQRYPWQAIVPPRVDNKNQPWYNNARDILTTPGAVAGVAGDVSSVVHSLGDVWGQMSDFWGGDTSKANLASTDSLPDSTPEETDVGGSSDDQSDAVADNSPAPDSYPEVSSFGDDNSTTEVA